MQVETHRDPAAPGRQGLIWQVLSSALASVATAGRAPAVLDCGGGSGSFAVPLAQAGARVTVVDISVDALATLRRRADEAAVGDLVNAVQADVELLGDAVGGSTFDLVLAHGILGAVDQVATAFEAIAAAVRPGGLLSVLVANPVAGVITRALAGDVSGALAELRGLSTDFVPPGPDAVQALCRDRGLLIESSHGIGVFADIVPGRSLDLPGARAALDALEAESATRVPFSAIAGRVHLLARRPAG
ncbi:MAG: class I SAM-dependent methyltransferase [Jatrophihabitantaceae bacterium]